MYEWRICARCQQEYPARAANARYCGVACRRASARVYVPVPPRVGACAECAQGFLSTRPRRYCSRRCQLNASQRRAYWRRRRNGEKRTAHGWVKEAA